MIKYVEYSNLNLSKQSITPYSKWIGSILQAIIDRNILDAYVNSFVIVFIYIRLGSRCGRRYTPSRMVCLCTIQVADIG